MLGSSIYIYTLQLTNNTVPGCIDFSDLHRLREPCYFFWLDDISVSYTQVSAWLHIHLCSGSQIQSRFHWFDLTTKGLCDGWKMRRALTCHFNPTCFHSRAPSFLTPACAVSSPRAASDIHVFSPGPPVPRPRARPVTSVPSPLVHTWLLRRSDSRARLWPTCIHKIVVIILEHF